MIPLVRRYWPLLALAAVCAALTSVLLAISAVQPEDLAVYRAGGYSLLHGIGLYGTTFPAQLPFTYPPFAAWPFVVLVPLPWGLTVWLWTFLTLLMLGWVIARTFVAVLPAGDGAADQTEQQRRQRVLLLAVLLIAFSVTTPMSDHIGYGQIDVLLMTMCLVDLIGPPSRVTGAPRWLPQGVLIGLAAALKLTPAAFVVYLVITRRLRAAVVAVASFVVATGAAWLVSPSDSHEYFFDLLWNLDVRVGLGNNAVIGNQSMDGAWLRILSASAAHDAWLASVVVVGIGGMWAAWRARRWRGEIAGACATGLVAILVSPVSWPHYLVWLIPAAGVALAAGWQRRAVIGAGVIYLVMVGRVHRLGQDLVDAVPHGPLRVLGEILRDAYTIECLVVLVWLATRPRRAPAGAMLLPRAA